MGSQKNHDKKILSHIKWASELIFNESRKKDKRTKAINNAIGLIRKTKPTHDDHPIIFYRFKYPIGKLEEDGIKTNLFQEIRIWREKEFDHIEKPGSLLGEIKITGDKVKFDPEEYFVLDIADKSRKPLKTIKIVLREGPRKDLKPREARTGREKIYPIENYIARRQRQTGLIPMMIPKSLKEEQWIKLTRRSHEIIFFREKPQRKRLPSPLGKGEKPRWVLVDHSYSLMDFYIQIGVYSIQAGLLADTDCLVGDYRKYLSKKNPRQYPKDNAVLKKALQYTVNSYFLPYHSATFEAYAKRTASALLRHRTPSPYQPKNNPEKDRLKEIRKYITKMRMQERGCSKETGKRWLSRKLKDYSLDDIYVNEKYLN